MRISSADWFKAGVARQRVGPISLGIAPRACMILSKLLLLLLLQRVIPSDHPDTKSKRGQMARTGLRQAPGGRGAGLVG